MKPAFDVISIGDTQYDVFLELEQETKVLKNPEDGFSYLGVVFGEKIPVKKYTAVPAVGNSANVAIGVSRLGLRAALYTVLGKDAVGKEEADILKQEKVARDYIVWDSKRGSNFSAVLNYKAERTILVHHEPREYALPRLALASWVYYSSVAAGHDVLHEQIPAYCAKSGAKLAFNPGSHQLHEGPDILAPILRITEVLFVNKEEAQVLAGKEDDMTELMRKIHALGPKIAVITEGPKGAYVSDGKALRRLGIFPAPLVERTGAGDAFATGFVSALAYGKDISEAMRWGAINSAFVIQYIGAREGLLKKDAMDRALSDNPQFMPTIL
ncbi:MAG: carbohydrate kinase family protein [Candidatus Wildermuthbacteria bacterium]|nr:carbohydrate kinase family protein [Candidatus Wildermuthbacteria bacterium]